MGFMPQGGGGSVTWANVADGGLHVGDKVFGGFSGVIAGIRTRPNEYGGKATTKLEIRMVTPENPEDAVIISGTMYNTDGSVTTWGRMMVARLAKEGNITPGELVEIGVYAAGETRATCASLRRRGDPTALQGEDMKKDDPRTCRSLVERAVAKLVELYPWSRGQSSEPAVQQASDEGPFDDDLPF